MYFETKLTVMKLRVFILAFGLSLSAWGQAAHTAIIAGSVIDSITGMGVPNYPVFVSDSSSSIGGGVSLTLLTDANGYYNDTVLLYSVNGMILVQTQDSCSGNWQSDYTVYTSNTPSYFSMYSSFMICGSSTTGGGPSNTSCQAGYAFDSTLTGMGQIVIYNTSFVDSTMQNPSVNYMWDFGDGSVTSGAYPSHIYTAPGTYSVCLTLTAMDSSVFGGSSCTSTFCDTIVVDSTGNVLYKNVNVTLNVYNPEQMSVKASVMDEIRVFPNPSSGLVWVDLPVLSDISLHTMGGQLLFSAKGVQEKTALPILPSGTYILDAVSGLGTARTMIVVR